VAPDINPALCFPANGRFNLLRLSHIDKICIFTLLIIKAIMKQAIIKLNLAGTIVHVNTNSIVYYYAKQAENGLVVTVMYLSKGWGIEISETPAEIDALLSSL
jgi:hypothetical protein